MGGAWSTESAGAQKACTAGASAPAKGPVLAPHDGSSAHIPDKKQPLFFADASSSTWTSRTPGHEPWSENWHRQSAAPGGRALLVPSSDTLKTAPHKCHNMNTARMCVFYGWRLPPPPACAHAAADARLSGRPVPTMVSAHALGVQPRLARLGPVRGCTAGWRNISTLSDPQREAQGSGLQSCPGSPTVPLALESVLHGAPASKQHALCPNTRSNTRFHATQMASLCHRSPHNRPSRRRSTGRGVTKTLCHHWIAYQSNALANPLLMGMRACRIWKLSVRERWYSIISAKPQARALGCERTAHVANRIKLHRDLLRKHVLYALKHFALLLILYVSRHACHCSKSPPHIGLAPLATCMI